MHGSCGLCLGKIGGVIKREMLSAGQGDTLGAKAGGKEGWISCLVL